jgi:beta-fructofuranosidase
MVAFVTEVDVFKNGVSIKGTKVKKRGIASTRREFLVSTVALASASLMPRQLAGQVTGKGGGDLEGKLADDPMRPQFHLLPAKNWMNDPNGPIYFNGRYHMFFQYNPHAAVWGDMNWNHAVSSDMLHWTHLPLALTPTPGSADSYGCFSGSAIQVGQRVYFVYTGTKENTPELATIHDGQNRIQESQCLAWSDDPQLIKWTKAPQPIVPLPPAGTKVTGFRDPSAWKQGEWYYMTVGSGMADVGGCVLLYRSKDLKNWEYVHELTKGSCSGKGAANPCEGGDMWECPEFFALDGGHVLIYSTMGKVFWQSGVMDEATMKFTGRKTGILDLGAFYAPKTQLDAHGRRILWGWIQERRSDAEMRAAGWSGMMSLPRVMRLDTDGSLRMEILPQTAALRNGAVIPTVAGKEATVTLPQATGEIRCSGKKGSGFEFRLSDGSAELMHVSYSPEKHAMTADGQEIVLEAADEPMMHVYVDGSVIEMILSGRTSYTKRFYYAQRTAPDVQARIIGDGAGVEVSAWKIKPISDNRLTSEAALTT